jgi:rhodanese-related sulfurtransferase
MENIGRRMTEIAQAAVASVSAQEVHDRRNAGETIIVLDVREPDEWAQGHIEGATLLARGRLEGRVEDVVPDKDACIIAH